MSNGAAHIPRQTLKPYCQVHFSLSNFFRIRCPQSAAGSSAYDDAFFRRELTTRLGPSRMQFVQVIDQLIYYDDNR